MADLSFLYLAFFLTLGSFLLGSIVAWNFRGIWDEWKARAEYAAVVMHPEMMIDGEMVDASELLYLRTNDDDDILDDEDD